MFLSIVIPVYNAEKYIRQCLESCYDQDLPVDDYELICINDGSKDHSLQILNDFAERYPNLTVVDQKNSGVSAARNRGIELAKAEYIWFVDSDDTIKPNCLGLLKAAAEDQCDIVTFSGYAYTEELTPAEQEALRIGQLAANMSYWGFVTIHIYKAKVVKEGMLRFDGQIAYGEDELFQAGVLERSSNIKTIEDVLYLYRGHAQSAMNSLDSQENRQKRLDSVIRAMIILKEGLESGAYVREETQKLLTARYTLCPYLIASLDRKRITQYRKAMRENGLFQRDFVKKYQLPGELKFILLYQRERWWDRLTSCVKTLLPELAVDYLRSLRK